MTAREHNFTGTSRKDAAMAFLRLATSGKAHEAQSRCLAVKLGAEVCDLSESMRAALERGTRGVIERLARCIEAGRADGSLPAAPDAQAVAVAVYQSWLGASLLAKITRDRAPLDTAMAGTRQLLGLAQDA